NLPGVPNIQADTVPPLPGTPDQTPAPFNSASTTSLSLASGTLAQASEAAIAISVTGNGGGAVTWGGGWTPIDSELNGSSAYLSTAYQVTSSTSAVTASGTLGVAAAVQLILLTFPIAAQNVGSLAMGSWSISGTGTVQSSGTGITGSGGLAFSGWSFK